MRRILSAVIAIVLMITANSYALAFDNSESVDNLSLFGVAVSVFDFTETFGAEERVSVSRGADIFADATLLISTLQIEDERISAQLVLEEENKELDCFDISGELCFGYRSQISDASSLVLNTESDSENTQVLLFELVKGCSSQNHYAEYDITKNSALRIYLKRDNTLFLFEESLPECFSSCFLYKSYGQMTDPTKDFLWFSSFLQPKIENTESLTEKEQLESYVNPELIRDTGSTLWTGDTTYQVSYTENGNTYTIRSLPFGYYRISDVSSSDTTWKAELYIAESTRINNNPVSGYENLIRYKNVNVDIACGRKTEFQNLSSYGRLYKENLIVPSTITTAVLDILSAALNWWDISSTVFNVFSYLMDTGDNITMGGSAYSSFPSGTTGVGISLPSNLRMFNGSTLDLLMGGISLSPTSHYLIVQTELNSTYTSSGSTSTSGAVRFEWETFLNSDFTVLDSNGMAQYSVAYTAQY